MAKKRKKGKRGSSSSKRKSKNESPVAEKNRAAAEADLAAKAGTLQTPSRPARFWRLGWQTVIAIATVLSLSPLVIYWNALSVSATQFSSDPNDPLSHVFTIKNTSILPLYTIYPECAVNLMLDGKPWLTNVVASALFDPVQKLGPLENFDAMCPISTPIGIDERVSINLDICMRGLYKPLGLPLERQQLFRFVMIRNSKREVYWSMQPASECQSRFGRIDKRLDAAKKAATKQ